jgi:hypothetical protein
VRAATFRELSRDNDLTVWSVCPRADHGWCQLGASYHLLRPVLPRRAVRPVVGAQQAVGATCERDQISGRWPGYPKQGMAARPMMEDLGVPGPQIAVKLFEEGLEPDKEAV